MPDDASVHPLTIGLQMLDLGQLAFGPRGGGWAWWTTRDMPVPDGVVLRFAERGTRLEVVNLVMIAEVSGLTSELLKAVPIARLEAIVNGPRFAAAVRVHIAGGKPQLNVGRLVDLSARDLSAAPKDLDAEEIEDAGEGSGMSIVTEMNFPMLLASEMEPSTIPASGRKPDEFYRSLAEQYSWLAAAGPRPAAILAAINHVPPSTVHRWVREARRRGLLAPGERSAVNRPARGGREGEQQ